MADIVLVKSRNRYFVLAETEQGRKYLEGKHIGFSSAFSTPDDVVDDLLEDYRNDGMEVEVK